MKKEVSIQRNMKDNLFCDLFSQKENALSLYNALNKTNYNNPEELKIVTLSDAIYLHQKNDVSILFQNQLVLWEQQSTPNYNMPLRGLIYFAHNIDGILAEKKINLYGNRIVKIPTPDYYVLYNGQARMPEMEELKLSEAFLVPTKGYEWTAHMININAGQNANILEKCPPLKGYTSIIQYIRNYQKEGYDISEAVNRAVNRCIKEGQLEAYLSKKKSEVYLMLLTEFNEAEYIKTIREEEREEARRENFQILYELVQEQILTMEQAAAKSKLSVNEFQKKLQKYHII